MGSGNSKKKGNLIATHVDHDDVINCMALSEDCSLLITGSEDATARMWSTQTEDLECLGVLRGHGKYISCVAIFDTFGVTGSGDNTIRKWHLKDCSCIFVYEGHTSKINRLICTGEFIFSSSNDKMVKAWLFDVIDLGPDNEEKACIRTFTGHTKGVIPITFIPGSDLSYSDEGRNIHPGDVLLTGSQDTTARSWSFESGKVLKTYKGHKGAITCMIVDPTLQFLFTGSADTEIRKWNINTGQNVLTLRGHTGGILCMTMANHLLFSGSTDCTASCWVGEDRTRIYERSRHSVICIKFSDGVLI